MALRGKKPATIEKRLKALFYGPAGVGKTTAAIQFPAPYLIDTERGAENAQYVKALEERGGVMFQTSDADEVIREVTSLISEKHSYRTLIIDPLTVIYNDLLDKSSAQVGTEFGRHKIEPDRKIKHLCTLLLRLDMNVIITSHAKPNWVRTKDAKGKDTAVQEGVTFDCYPRLDYLFDLVFEIAKRGKDRIGTVRKSRVESFPEGEVFPFDYQSIAAKYGQDVLERTAAPIVLASEEQARTLRAMLADRKDGEALEEKWLKVADAERIEEMPAESVVKCIAFLTPKPVTV